jgi:poly-gamma-glutamate biosynthesis protein PgsC/CapC
MTELLPVSIGIGLAMGLLIGELFGIASGGLIVPGYIALYLFRPVDLLLTVGTAIVVFGVVSVLENFFILYGKRRTALMIMIAYLLSMLIRSWTGTFAGEWDIIGYIIPGLIAVWMDRQGIVETLTAMTIVSVSVRLLLIISVGGEIPT